MPIPLRIIVLISGSGTNLQALIDEEKSDTNCPYTICGVFSDKKSAYGLERAKAAQIPTEIVSASMSLGERFQSASRDEKRFAISNRILELAKKYQGDAIVLAGFLSVLTGKLLEDYRGKIINLHPALLPKFGGEGMWGHHVHEAVLASGEKESGCTVHFVDAGCDTGKIILQRKVPVLPHDTVESLYQRIAPEEHKAIVEALKRLATGQI